MTASGPATRTVEIDDEVYEVLARTAASRDTDINGALRYLIEAPTVPASPAERDDGPVKRLSDLGDRLCVIGSKKADDRGRIIRVDDVKHHHALRRGRAMRREEALFVRIHLNDRTQVLTAPAIARKVSLTSRMRARFSARSMKRATQKMQSA